MPWMQEFLAWNDRSRLHSLRRSVAKRMYPSGVWHGCGTSWAWAGWIVEEFRDFLR